MSINIKENNGQIQVIQEGDGIQVATIYNSEKDAVSNGIIDDFLDLVKNDQTVSDNLTDEQKNRIKDILKELDSNAVADSDATKKKGADVWLNRIKSVLDVISATGAVIVNPCWGVISNLVKNFFNRL